MLTDQVGSMEGLHIGWTQNNAAGEDTVGCVYGINTNNGSCSGSKSVRAPSEVMGTCPPPKMQKSYYIAGLAYYANTVDLRTELPGQQSLYSFFIDTQEFNQTPLDGNRNMFYLAGKHGSFTDLNNNMRPDLITELDADGDGQPDNYVLASLPENLVSGLQRAFNNVLEKTGTAGSVTSNSTRFASDTVVYQALFNSGTWSGDLLTYSISASGIAATPVWNAAERIPSPSDRRIYTRSGGSVVPFAWTNLASTDQTAIGSADVVEYRRGNRSKELQNGGSFRNRANNNVLGDIVHSSPFYVNDTNTVFIGANDGMLQAFDAASGQELYAYIQSALIPKPKKLSEPNYTHDYFVDGDIAVSSRSQTIGKNYLTATLGRGGKGLFELDVTNPASFGVGDAKWECFYSGGTVTGCNDDPDLGYMLGRPMIARMSDGNWAVIVGNGYNSDSGKSALYIFKLSDGTLIKKIGTGIAGDNGLMSPGVFDEEGDGDIDVIYAGDLKGNAWNFNVSHSNKHQWDVAFKSGSTPQPLFTATNASGQAQPITAQITVALNSVTNDPNYGKRYIFFGTGGYFRAIDPSDSQVQSWYGLIDKETRITSRSELVQRTIQQKGTFDGKTVRTFFAAGANDLADMKGWFLGLTTQTGERIVTDSNLVSLIRSTPVASSIIPVNDLCVPGGNSFINAIDPLTGGGIDMGILDVNDNGGFSDDKLNGVFIGGFGHTTGILSDPILVGGRLVTIDTSGKSLDVRVNRGTLANKARISWREIIQD